MPRKFLRRDTNSLLSGGLLALLLFAYVALAYVAVVAVGMLSIGGLGGRNFSPPWWLNLIDFALIAITFWPVTRWLRSRVNDLVYAQHDDPYTLISKVNQHLQAMTSPQLTLPALAETIARQLKLPFVAIEFAHANPPVRYAFGVPRSGATINSLPIAYLDQAMGTLFASARGADQMLSENDLTLLRDASQQVGIALHVAQLAADLQASRERLVIAHEEERRRIRNDLHDGLAPTLSALQLQLGAMRTLIRQDPQQAETVANDLREDLRHATAEIRQLVYGLRPPMLDELGLVGALKNSRLQGSAISLDVIAPEPMPTLPAAVEVAVYRIASEAIHNVVQHAHATACQVCITVADGQLALTVTDNGQSLPPANSAGIGLHSMKERAAELGGTFALEPGQAGGARVVVRLPIHT